MMMQRSVWFLFVCGVLVSGCVSGGGDGNSALIPLGTNGGVEAEDPGEEGEGTGGESEGAGGEGTSSEGEGTGGEEEGEGGEGEGTDGEGESTGSEGEGTGGEDPVMTPATYAELLSNFQRLYGDYDANDTFSVDVLIGSGADPLPGTIQYNGQLFLSVGTINPAVMANVFGAATLDLTLADGSFNGLAKDFRSETSTEVFTGDIIMTGGKNLNQTTQHNEMMIVIDGDLDNGNQTFEIGGILAGSFSGETQQLFRATASLRSADSETYDVGEIDGSVIGNEFTAGQAMLLLER